MPRRLTVLSEECAHCSGKVRPGIRDKFYHANGDPQTETIALEIRCLVKSHKDCTPVVRDGKVTHVHRRSR